MKFSQIKAGTFLSFLQMGLGLVISLAYTPLMIRLLGTSEYGLYNTVSSTVATLTILNLGFGSSYIRYYSKYKVTNDDVAISKLNGLFLIVFLVISIIGLICGLTLTQFLEVIFNEGLNKHEYTIARVLMVISTINLAVSFPMSLFINVISAHERFVFLKLVGMLQTVLVPLLTIPLLLIGYRSIALALVTLVVSLISNGIYIYFVVIKLRNRFVFYGFEKGILRNILSYTSFIALNLIIDQINWNIDKIILGRFCGMTAVALYSVGYTLYHHFQMFSTSISNVFIPSIHRIVRELDFSQNEKKMKLTDIFIKVGRIQFFVLALVASGFVFFGKTFIIYWAGADYNESFYVALILMISAMVPLIQNIGIEIQRAQDKHKFRSIVYFFMAIVNLFISIYLCQRYGAIGSAMGTALALIVANGIIMNVYYHKQCNIDIVRFWKSIISTSPGLILPFGFGFLYTKCIHVNAVFELTIYILLYIIVYCISVWLISMNNTEKKLITVPLQKIFGREQNK